MSIIKVESFTEPITTEVLSTKEFSFASGGSGGGGGSTINNFYSGLSNIETFETSFATTDETKTYNFVLSSAKKIILFFEIISECEYFVDIDATTNWLFRFNLNGGTSYEYRCQSSLGFPNKQSGWNYFPVYVFDAVSGNNSVNLQALKQGSGIVNIGVNKIRLIKAEL